MGLMSREDVCESVLGSWEACLNDLRQEVENITELRTGIRKCDLPDKP